DVVLSRKLRAPGLPEAAIGAVAEDGTVYLDPEARDWVEEYRDYVDEEVALRKAEIVRRKKRLREGRAPARVAGRSVIVTDDGIATGSTMIAALKVLAPQKPHEVIVAVPVGPADRVAEVGGLCDEVVCLRVPPRFYAIGPFYQDFRQVGDDEVM